MKKKLLDYATKFFHNIWANWMSHQFSVSQLNEDGSVTIPKEKVERWKRQMMTTYEELTEKEKKSDRDQVFKMIRYFEENAAIKNIINIVKRFI